MLYIISITCLLWTVTSGTTTKTWLANTNYWNGDNWNLKRIPCRSDRVIFPPTLDAAVYLLSGTTAMKELILPMNGELILPTGQLLVTGSAGRSSAECPGEDMVFTGGEEHAWLDSSNWGDAEGKAWLGGDDSPIPHVERIPCPTDQVIFPDESSFKVKLPEVPVTVGSIYIQGKSTTTNDLQSMIMGNTGYNLFKGDAGRLIVQGETCSDPKGCACNGNQYSETMEILCSYEKKHCKDPLCENPVQPVGHCCKICGAILVLSMDANRFSRDAVNIKLAKYVNILSYMSRLDSSTTQVVFREQGLYKGDSSLAATQLAKELQNYELAGIKSVKLITSGEPITSLGSTGSIVLVTFFIIILFLGTGALLALGYRRHRSGLLFPTEMPSFHFRRFENTSGPVDGEVEIAKTAEMVETKEKETMKAFDNPMYDNPNTSSVASTSGTLLKRPKVTGRGTVTIENPTYKALQASVHQDMEDIHIEPLQHTSEDDQPPTFGSSTSSKYEALHEEE